MYLSFKINQMYNTADILENGTLKKSASRTAFGF